MEKRTKQIITGITANLLFLPPIYFAFLNKETAENWKIISISFLPLIVVLIGFRFAWKSKAFTKSPWREEGFSSFSEWFQKSETSNARLFRLSIKYISPVLIGLTIIAGFAIKLSN